MTAVSEHLTIGYKYIFQLHQNIFSWNLLKCTYFPFSVLVSGQYRALQFFYRYNSVVPSISRSCLVCEHVHNSIQINQKHSQTQMRVFTKCPSQKYWITQLASLISWVSRDGPPVNHQIFNILRLVRTKLCLRIDVTWIDV